MSRANSPIFKVLATALVIATLLQMVPAYASVSTSLVASDAQIGNSGAGSLSLGTSGGQKLIQDRYGNMIAVYVDSLGRLALRYAKPGPNPLTWSNTFTRADSAAYAYPAAVLVNSTSLRIIAQGGVQAGDIVDVPVTISRDAQQNISSLQIGSPGAFLDNSIFANYPTAVLAHSGDILSAWSWRNTSNSSRVKTLRWNHITNQWGNFAGSSSTPDSPIIDTIYRNASMDMFPAIIERNDSVHSVYLLGNRGNSGPANLVFNKATFNGGSLSWSWGTSNLNYETDMAHGIEDQPSVTWDAVKNLLVVAYAKTGSTQYNVFTLTSADVKTHLDTPPIPAVLSASAQDYGRITANQTSGDYFLIFQDSSSDAATGSIGYVRSPAGTSAWNTTFVIIDSNTNNRGIALRRTGTSNSFDLLYENEATNPGQIRLARITTSPLPLAASFTYTPSTPSPGQPVNFTGTPFGGTSPYTFAWNFGDQTTGSGSTVTHAYAVNGTYAVQLTITDHAGNTATAQNAVIVSSGRFTFAAAGDWDFNSNTQANWNSLGTSGANFVIPVGDFLYTIPGSGNPTEQNWCSSFKGAIPNVELIVGNHETLETNATGGGSMNKFVQYCPFTLGSFTGTYGYRYYFDYPLTTPLARFILVNADIWNGTSSSSAVWYGNNTVAGRANQLWVTNAIADARSRGISWIIIGNHKDCISAGSQPCEIDQSFMDLLINNHVDLVLEGHDHNYQRSKELSCATAETYRPSCVVNPGPTYTKGVGTIFQITGTGGDTLNGINTSDGDYQYFAATNSDTFGYMKYTLTGTSVQAQFVRTSGGSFTDSYSIGDLPPTVSFTESATTVSTGTPITLTITATDTDSTPVASIKVVWGDGTIDTLAATATSDTHSYAVAGTYTVYVNATDTGGKTGQSSKAIKTITDRPPVVGFTESATTVPTGTSITLTITATDPDGTVSSLKVSWGDGTVDTLAGTATTDSHSYAAAGSFIVYVNATDNAALTTKSSTATKTITDRAPTVSFTESATNVPTGTSISLTITAADPDGTVSSLKVSWGDGTVDTLAGTATTDSHSYASSGSAKVGTFSVYVNATDNAGLTTKSAVATKTVNDRPPTVSFTESATNVPTGTSITLTITAADPDGTVASLKVSWGEGTVDTLAGSATTDSHSYAVAGSYSVYVNATDNSGSTIKSSVATKTITDRPPTVSFTETLTTVNTGQSITLTITAADPDGTVTSLKVSWGDGTVDTLAGTATTDSHSYALAGSYSVYVNATDNSGSTTKSSTASKTIIDRPPTVSFTESATTASTGTAITLTITAADPDGTVASLQVSWGDGIVDTLTGTATTDSHSYAVAGTFSVYVNATDNSGSTTKSAVATKTITDRAPTVSFTENTTTGTTTTVITLTITAADPDGTVASLKVSWGDGTVDTLAGTAMTDSHTYTAQNTYTVSVNATDNAGLTTKSATASKVISTNPIVVSFTENTTTATTGQAITLTISASEAGGTISSLKVVWGDGTIDTLAGTATTDSHAYTSTGSSLSQTFVVYVNATDSTGRTQKSSTANKVISDRAPTVSFTESATNVPTSTSITLTMSAADPDGTVASLKVSWGDGIVDTLVGTATTDSHSYAVAGSYSVYVNATDNSGSTTKTAVATKTITDRAPTVSFTESATTAPTGTLLTLTITAGDPDGSVVSLKVVWGDGTIDTLAGTAASDSHAYSSTGNALTAQFTVYVNATDNSGSTTKSTSATKTISDRAPSVSFTESVTSALTGTSITLTISSSDSDGTVTSLKVVWGDGTIDTLAGTATSDSHAYANTGNAPTAQFTVYVNSTDNSGSTSKSSTATKTITDRPPGVTFTENTTTAQVFQTITLSITSSDPDGTVNSLKVVWGDGTSHTLAGTTTTDSYSYKTPGTFNVYVNATDNSGLTTKSATSTKTITALPPPSVSFTESTTTALTGQTITLTINASDPNPGGSITGIKVSWGDGTVDSLPGTATTDSHAYSSTGSTPTASFQVYVNATDNFGLTSQSAKAAKTINDRPPTVSFTESATSASTGTPITLTITPSDPDGTVTSLKVSWGDGTVDTLAGTAATDAHTYLSTGSSPSAAFQVYVNATDNSGQTTQSSIATKTITDRPPTVSFTESATNVPTGTSITLTITAADPDGTVSSLKVSWGDGTVDTLAGTATTDSHSYALAGSYSVHVNATDNAALMTKSAVATKTITDTAPTVSFTESATNVPTGTSITLTITAADPDGTVSGLKVSWGDGTVDSLAGTATSDSHSYAVAGSFSVYVNATDNSASVTKSSAATKTITDRPPTVSFTESATTASTGTPITLTITAADPDGTVASLKVSWGDGTVDTLAGTATSNSHAYANTGNDLSQVFSVYVNATDNSAQTTKSAVASKTIIDRAPTVSFTESTTTANVSQLITLTITAADPDGMVSSLKVSWGDGTVDTLAGTATTDSHAYSATGTFTVYVNATDNSGSVTKSATSSKTISPNQPPNVSFTENTTTATTGQTITLTITASDPNPGGSVTRLKISWGDGTVDTLAGTATSDSHAYSSTGSTPTTSFTVYVNATNNFGLTRKSTTATKVISDRAPTVSFTETVTTVSTGSSITLTITAADPDGSVSSLKVVWGDGTIDTLAGTATTDGHAYTLAGTYSVYVNATDNSGSTTKSSVATKIITDQPPVVSFTESGTAGMTATLFTLTISSSDPDGTVSSLRVVWGDGAIDILPGTATSDSHSYANVGNALSASFSVYVNATDNSGSTTKSAVATKTVTDRAPTVSFTESVTSGNVGQTITLTITAADPDGTVASLKVSWGDGTVDALAGTATSDSHSYSTQGTFTVYVNATDNSGQTTKSATASKTISPNPIVVTFTENTTSATTGQTITLTISASELGGTISSLKMVWGDGTIDTLAGTVTTDSHAYANTGISPTQTFVVYVNATDSTGRTQKSSTANKIISDRAPTVSFTESATNVPTGTLITLTITAADPDGTVSSLKVSWGDGTVDTLAGTAATDSHSYASTGSVTVATFSVYVNATDNSGSTTKSAVATKTVNDRAPTVSFTESATSAPTGTSITLTITSADPDGTVASLKVSWGDGIVDTLAGTATTDNHSYASTGSSPTATFTVYVNATDNSGSITKSSTGVKSITDRPPIATFTFNPTNPSVGQPVTFDGTQSADPDGQISGYSWDFGDGAKAIGSISTHTYTSSGTFAVALNVTDNSGNAGQSASCLTTANGTLSPCWPALSNLTVSNVQPRGLTLNWTNALDNVGVTAYRIYENNSLLVVLPSNVTRYSVNGLSPYTNYTFRVDAGNAAGNWASGPSRQAFPRLIGDVNKDCRVDIADLVLVARSFGSSIGGSNFNNMADLNGDGVIDIADLAIVGSNFGSHC
jgi:PKD repeat protein